MNRINAESQVMEHRIDVAGTQLHASVTGSGPALLILHGFTGSTETMTGIRNALCAEFTTICVDLPGHGESEAPEALEPYTISSCVEYLTRVLDTFHVARTNLFGYSMGGRIALAFAAAHPERLRAVAVLGASAGILDPPQRARRKQADDALAEFILSEGIEAFVERWMAHPLFQTQQSLGEAFLDHARAQRLRNRPLGLANALRGMGQGAQEPVFRPLANVGLPILLLAGVKDTKYCTTAIELAQYLHNARVEIIPAAGHAAHLERPEDVHEALAQFFRETLGSRVNQPFFRGQSH